MFTPPEIPLNGYIPPQTDAYLPKDTTPYYPHQNDYYSQSNNNYSSYYSPSYNVGQVSTAPYTTIPRKPALAPVAVPTFKALQPSQVYSQQPLSSNHAATQFNPNPLPYDKLAIFEPEIVQNPQFIRRPAFAPKRYGSVSRTTTYDSPSPNQQSWTQKTTTHKIYSTSSNYGQQIPPSQSPRFDYTKADNYNRAARGWGASNDYYRPVSFAKPIDLPYSDF